MAALLAFTAVPAVLVLVVGNPLSGGLGHSWQPVPRDALVCAGAGGVGRLGGLRVAIVRGVVVHVRRGEVRPLGVVSPLDRVAARIAIGVLALTSAGAPLVLASGAGAATPRPACRAVAATAGTARARRRRRRPTAVHTVRPGEGLWQIAEARLGDGADWMQVAALNLGRDMGGGQRFVDPDHVRAGLAAAPARRGAGHHARRDPHATARSRPSGAPDRLPELVALGVGSLACAALARRSRRRQRPAPFSGDLDLPLGRVRRRPSEKAVDADTLLQRFAVVPGPRRLRGRQLPARPRRGRRPGRRSPRPDRLRLAGRRDVLR